jgi:uncharacterized protein
MLIALDLWLGPMTELVLVGSNDDAANQQTIARLQQSYLPRCVIAYRGTVEASPGHRSAVLDPLFTGRNKTDSEPALYICQNFTCEAPVKGAADIQAAIEQL